MHPFELPPFRIKPGLILGPWDALTATMLWLKECYRKKNTALMGYSKNLKDVRISPEHRNRLFRAFLLFGHFDGLNGLFPADAFLKLIGIPFSRRDIFGALDFGKHAQYSPFAHPLEVGWPIGIMNSTITASPEDIRQLASSVSRILRKVGYKVITTEEYRKLKPENKHAIMFKEEICGQLEMILNGQLPVGSYRTFWPDYLDKPKIVHGHVDVAAFGLGPVQHISTVSLASVAALERSVSSSTPLMSVDIACPAWLSNSQVNEQLVIFKIIFEEVNWLPQPQNFQEAYNMFYDDRMVSLRENIQCFFEMYAAGDGTNFEQIRQDVKKSVDGFKSKSWASSLCRVVTYMAVPTSVAEALVGSIGIGMGVGIVGAASQLLGDAIAKNKQKSWLSIGRDFI